MAISFRTKCNLWLIWSKNHVITLLLSNKGLRWICAFTKPISEFYYRHLNRSSVHFQYVNLNASETDGYCEGKTCSILPVIGTKKTSAICNVRRWWMKIKPSLLRNSILYNVKRHAVGICQITMWIGIYDNMFKHRCILHL